MKNTDNVITADKFLPVRKPSADHCFDFIAVTGDAYVDHPAFGFAVITRFIEAEGFSVGVIAQPVSERDYTRLGAPAVAFLVTGGNIDSMVSNYTVAKKRRHKDEYSAEGVGGKRPDRAVTAYCRALRRLYPDTPQVIGGLEASLRRFAHYDYWADCVMPSILADSGADLLLYGMAERTLAELCSRLRKWEYIGDIHDLRGTCHMRDGAYDPDTCGGGVVVCESFAAVSADKRAYARAARTQYDEQDEVYGKTIVQQHGDRFLVQNPPQYALTKDEFDRAYELPYARTFHPMYKDVPAIREVEFSVTHNRGCFGFCNFCSIALHQGRRIQTRSHESVLREVAAFTDKPGFKGYVHDVGGPTANFRRPSCTAQLKRGLCRGRKCFNCDKLEVDHTDYLALLGKVARVPGVKKVFVRSGIRYDYVNRDGDARFLRELVANHVSGQIKVAPEHICDNVLNLMGKPRFGEFTKFRDKFYSLTKQCGKEQYLVPYFMSSHPGCTLENAVELARYMKKNNIRAEQVQDFYPTPGTLSTAMYYTGLDPYTMREIYVARTPGEKQMQRALLQYYKPENRAIVAEAFRIADSRGGAGGVDRAGKPVKHNNHDKRRGRK